MANEMNGTVAVESLPVSGLPLETRLFIDNEFVDEHDGTHFDTSDPTNAKVIARVQEAGKDDVDRAVKAASRAFEGWSQSSGAFRAQCLNRLADLMDKHMDQLAEMESLDNGKPLTKAKEIDVPFSLAVYRYYAGWADGKLDGKQIPISAGNASANWLCYQRREPIGVCGQIIPWNFPLAMFSWKVAPAVAAGCTVVIKTSEKTPLTGLMMGHLCKEAGFPPGVINILSGHGPTTGEYIVRHPMVDKVAFTGSVDTAQKVLLAAAQSGMKKVTTELGRKSPLIVCKDADLDQALTVAHEGLFFNAGQSCIASSRVFVDEAIYDKFVEKALKRAKEEKLCSPNSPECTQGPVVDMKQFDRVMNYISLGKQEGATLLTGGTRHGTQGYWIEPTIFTDVKDDMRIAKEEIFGPVMTVLKFKTLEEAIVRANATSYGLGAGICSRDIGRALSVAHKLRAGTIYVNCWNVVKPNTPFGGYKQSGVGRELGEDALDNYLEKKTVIVDLSYEDEKDEKAAGDATGGPN
ncbi:unnamed protein product [Vitrella brassicaformis CCMP3155]|uniref:Aldehyde dehydrogenase domain-containing protein n=2 Tax=Vitrella brassicaformis TaxID=1169539 RepID=A0A0G4EI59_VITBC|nr:unnamed protein product [Vitrella brassicaformis CCMP3155]|eukprot:CEL95933.1 unnamed protein product [Vitrella brassicaformis CCMP3155]